VAMASEGSLPPLKKLERDLGSNLTFPGRGPSSPFVPRSCWVSSASAEMQERGNNAAGRGPSHSVHSR
jgi:hypothetical protein